MLSISFCTNDHLTAMVSIVMVRSAWKFQTKKKKSLHTDTSIFHFDSLAVSIHQLDTSHLSSPTSIETAAKFAEGNVFGWLILRISFLSASVLIPHAGIICSRGGELQRLHPGKSRDSAKRPRWTTETATDRETRTNIWRWKREREKRFDENEKDRIR